MVSTLLNDHPSCNCRIHHVTTSMTTIDLYNKPRTERFQRFWSRWPHFLNSPLRRFQAENYVYIFQSVLPLLLFSSYPLPILTMHHTIAQMWRPLNVCLPVWNTQYGVCRSFRMGLSDLDISACSLVTIAKQLWSVDPSIAQWYYICGIVNSAGKLPIFGTILQTVLTFDLAV